MAQSRQIRDYELRFLALWIVAWNAATALQATIWKAFALLREAMLEDPLRWDDFWEYEFFFPLAEYFSTTLTWIGLTTLMWLALTAPFRRPALALWLGVIVAFYLLTLYTYEIALLWLDPTAPVNREQLGFKEFALAYGIDVVSWVWLPVAFLFVGWRYAACLIAAVLIGTGLLMVLGIASFATSFLTALTVGVSEQFDWGNGIAMDELLWWIAETTIAAVVTGVALIIGHRLDPSDDETMIFA
ncbi:MAG: hypothetical protein AAF439_12750 [Pseudomonadota bacterium]